MAQYTVRATPKDDTSRLKAEDKRKGRVLTEVVTSTTLDEVAPEPAGKGFRRTKQVLKKKRP